MFKIIEQPHSGHSRLATFRKSGPLGARPRALPRTLARHAPLAKLRRKRLPFAMSTPSWTPLGVHSKHEGFAGSLKPERAPVDHRLALGHRNTCLQHCPRALPD